MSGRDFLHSYIASQSIFHSGDKQLLSRQGTLLKWMIDLRPMFLNVSALNHLCAEFWKRYEDQWPFQIAAMEMASIPLLTALQISGKKRGFDLNGVIIRKVRKEYGSASNIEGTLNDDPVIVIDDTLNSGESLTRAQTVLDSEHKTLKEIFVIIDYHSSTGLGWRKQNNLKVHGLFKLSEFDLSITDPLFIPPEWHYEIQWRFYEKGAFPFSTAPKSTPLLVEDKIVMGLESGAMVCVSAKDGREIWRFDIPVTHRKGVWSSPAHHNGKIYFGAYNGNVYCLNLADGSEVWKNPCCEYIGSSPLIVAAHNALYIGLEYERPREKGSHAAFDLDTGARLWEIGLKQYEHGSAAYYAPEDLVIFGSNDHCVVAREAKTGKTVWQHDTLRSIKYAPAVDEESGMVACASFDGNIYVLNAKNGERLAAIQTDDICYTTPLFAQGKIFSGSGDRHLYIIDAKTGALLHKMDCGARVYSSPRLLNGHVVFGTNGGRIYEIDPDSFLVKGMAQLPDSVPNALSASTDGTMLYAATHMNEIYGIARQPIQMSASVAAASA